MAITLTEKGMRIETRTTRAEFEGIRLVSLQDAASGEEYLQRNAGVKVPGFELLHQNGKVSPLGKHPLASRAACHLLTERIAEIVLNDWECDLSVRVSIDEENGDILLEPSAWAMQGGIAGLAFNLAGIRTDLDVVAPFQQGVRAPLSHAQLQGKKAEWPHGWELAFLVFAGKGSGFSVQAWDSDFIYKGVAIGHAECPQSVGFMTYAHGPLENNRCTGNLCWRICAYRGPFSAPVLRFRDWYWKAYRLEDAARMRPEWLDDIRLAVSWCPTNLALLDALAAQVEPKQVFLHMPDWRPFIYDQDYPTYTASAAGRIFIEKARGMGFHVAPHTNTCQMSPDHPFFFQARDFCTRAPSDMRWGGWSWLPVEGWKSFGPPQSYSLMPSHKDWNVLVNVHLAWSPWRRHLTRQVASLAADLGLDSIFVDVAQWIHNSDNSVLENLTYGRGSLKLIRELSELAPGFCVAGESRNEISTQYLSVVQYHLLNFAHVLDMEGKDVSWLLGITEPVNELVFQSLTRGIGYSYGSGANRRSMIDATMKQGTPIEPISKKIASSPNPCVLLTTGSFCPIHQGHIDMVVAARNAVEKAGYQVLAGYVSAGHDEYINLKTKDKAIPIHHRIDFIQQLIEENNLQDWLMPDAWEGIFNQVAVNFTDVVYRLELYLEALFGQKIPVFFICGGDNARFAMTFMQKGFCVVVGRPGYEERFNLYKNKLADCRQIIWADGDSALSSTQIRAKENFSPPTLRQLYLRIENQDERVVALLELLKPYFQSIQCTYLSEQEAIYKKISPADTISLDAYLPGSFNLEISRVYDLMGWRQLGYTNRPGSEDLKNQIKNIPKGNYCLFDDDIHTGNTMKFAQNLLEEQGINVCAILAMNLYQKKNYTATEVLDCRDFLVGGVHNGLVVKTKDKEVRVPYLYPYVCPWVRASIPNPMAFSIQAWKMNADYYQKHPTKLGDCAPSVQTLFGLIGFTKEDSLFDICQWHVDLLCDYCRE